MLVYLDHVTTLTTGIMTFYFKSAHSFRYNAGQFIELTIPHNNPDDRGIKRWFTLSSSPSQELLSITTKISADNGSSFKKALQALVVGDELTMSDAMGDFVLPKLEQTPLIFVAGGIGITPFHSMLQWMIDTGERRPIKFIYAVRTENEIVFLDTFRKAKQHVTVIVSEPSAAWGGEQGRVDSEKIVGLEKPTDTTLIYLSGPEAMIETLAEQLVASGLRKNQLVTDNFPGYSEL